METNAIFLRKDVVFKDLKLFSTALPKEIIFFIFSFLKAKDHLILSHVNQSFLSLYDLLLLRSQVLFEKKIQRLGFFEAGLIYEPQIHYLNQNVCFLSKSQGLSIIRFKPQAALQGQKDRVDLNNHQAALQEQNDGVNLNNHLFAWKILEESPQYFILGAPREDHAFGIEKSSGKCIFLLDIRAALKLTSLRVKIDRVFLCSENPLTFVLFTDKTLTKWTFVDKKLELQNKVELAQVPTSITHVENNLYLQFLEGKEPEEVIISLETLEKQEIFLRDIKIFGILNSHVDKRKLNNGPLLIANEGSKTTLSFLDVETLDSKWTKELNLEVQFLASSESGQHVVLRDKNSSSIFILDTETGSLLGPITFDQKHTGVELKAPFLFLTFGNQIQVLNILNGKLRAKWTHPEKNVVISDIYYDGLNLYFTVKKGNVHFLEALPIKKLPKSDSSDSFEGEVPLGNPAARRNFRSRAMKTTMEITQVALHVLSYLLFAAFILAYYKGAINLSIGLGCGMGLSVISLIGVEVYQKLRS